MKVKTATRRSNTPTTTPLPPTLVYKSTGRKLFALIIPEETVSSDWSVCLRLVCPPLRLCLSHLMLLYIF